MTDAEHPPTSKRDPIPVYQSLPPTRPRASTWPGALVDAIAIAMIGALALIGRVDGMVALLVLAFVLGVRVPVRRGGALLTLVSPLLDVLRFRS